MLTENDIIDLLGAYFEKMGNKVLKATTSQKGIDLITEDSFGNKTYIEAKGETSSKINSKRYNMGFTPNQIRTHISVALMQTFRLMYKEENSKIRFGIALPENHRELITEISPVIKKLNIVVYFVSKEGISIF